MSLSVNVDNTARDEWERCAREFADYSIYQTWPYQQVRGEMEGQEVSRVLVRNESGVPVLMAHVRIKRVPLLGLRIGYVQWGPLVRRRDGDSTCSVEAMDAFRKAYLRTKVNVLRVMPLVWDDDPGRQFSAMLGTCGFEHVKYVPPYRTFVLWVGDSEHGIRDRLRKSYRRDLRYGEKAGVEIREGLDESSLQALQEFYHKAKCRKGFEGVDPDQFIKAQPSLSPAEKMRLLIAYRGEEAVAVFLASNLGETSVVLLVACDDKALSCFASYVLWYQGAVAACQDGMKWCDLGGIDPDRNPNVYQFKSRMAPEDVRYIGTFEAYHGRLARTLWYLPGRIHNFTRSR